ncbi:hypothetical protein DTO012A9_8482 [Penicillium roqueforti]|nr:hypothetical protein CBS147311_887 [Penicillium roqueforti]KAI3230146.1 hypothetical protein DTO012A9_8482 [Penicillium roqueforti]KAI3239699.1 hypothetical protein CBS147310_2329 [Penicillium roqueforti]
MKYQYFYRCFSLTSAGGPRSGAYDKYFDRPKLSEHALLSEFDSHRNKWNGHPTALVSVTDRPLEALNRALGKYNSRNEDKIWIICIKVPKADVENGPHHAQRLAEELGLDSNVFRHEYLFEWEIPEDYILRIVSLRAILAWRIEDMRPLEHGVEEVSFSTLRDAFRREILTPDPYATGRWLYRLTKAFRTCGPRIAFQIYLDSLGGGFFDSNNQTVRYDGFGCIEFSDISYIEQQIGNGIDDEFENDCN